MNLTIFSAGSLRHALPAMLAAVGQRADITFGPAGLLRWDIESGERPCLYLSASMTHALAVAELEEYAPAVEFAENRLCLFGRAEVLEGGDALAAMLHPGNRLGTSTPVADPGGDYAFSVFDRAEAVLPGSRERLRAKAQPLVGGSVPRSGGPARSPVQALFKEGRVDLFLGYRTTALDVVAAVDGLDILDLPESLAVRAVYGATLRKAAPEAVAAFASLRTSTAIEALERYGFSRRG